MSRFRRSRALALAAATAIFPAAAAPTHRAAAHEAAYTVALKVFNHAEAPCPEARIELSLLQKAPWSLHTETAFSCQLEAPSGVHLRQQSFTAADLQRRDHGLSLSTTLAPNFAAGTLTGPFCVRLDLFVCDLDVCERHRELLSLSPESGALKGATPHPEALAR